MISIPQPADGGAFPGPGIALRDYGLAELTVAIDALGARGNRLHEGVHDARKAIRRTRAMLALAESALGPGGRLIDRQLRRANRRLSTLRDAHALVETLDRLGLHERDESKCLLLERARRSAIRRRAAMARQPEFAQEMQHGQAVLVTLRAALPGLPWESLSASTVSEAMYLAAQRAESARERAFDTDDAADWHRWRRRMRRISQQHRAVVETSLPLPTVAFDKKLTEQLGEMQDLSLLVAHCGKDSPFPDDSSQALKQLAKRRLERQRKRIRTEVRRSQPRSVPLPDVVERIVGFDVVAALLPFRQLHLLARQLLVGNLVEHVPDDVEATAALVVRPRHVPRRMPVSVAANISSRARE